MNRLGMGIRGIFASGLWAVLGCVALAPLAAGAASFSAEWAKEYEGADRIFAAAVDGSGNVYLTGEVRNDKVPQDDDDLVTMKVAPDGTLVWKQTYDHGGDDAWDWAYDVDVDPDGNVFVGGERWNGTDDDFQVVKYSRTGKLAWVRVYDSVDRDDRFAAAAADAFGNVIVAGHVAFFSGMDNQWDIVLVKYDARGEVVWERRYDTGVHDWPTSIATDPAGNLFVTVTSRSQESEHRWSLLKYDAAGELLWTRELSAGPYYAWSVPIAADATGAYVAVPTWNGADVDLTTSRLDPAGNVVWSRSAGNPGVNEVPATISIDGAGGVYVSASADGNDGRRTLVLRYDANGALGWEGGWAGAGGMVLAADPRRAGFHLASETPLLVKFVSRSFRVSSGQPPAGVVGTPYVHTFTAAGGSAPYTWAVSQGTLPAGLTLDPATGTLGGTPTRVAPKSFVVQATDAKRRVVVDGVAMSVYEPLALTVTSLPPAVVGQPYSATVGAIGGSGYYYTFTLAAGALPPGLTLGTDPSGGVPAISGIPEITGTFDLTLQVADTTGLVATRDLTLVVDSIDVSPAVLADGTVGRPYAQDLLALQGTPPFSWSVVAGSLPPGVTLDAATGILSGTPSSAGVFGFDVQVVDGPGLLSGVRRRVVQVADVAEQWRAQPPPDADGNDQYSSVAVDAAGNSFVGGTLALYGAGGTLENALRVTKRDPAGNVLWQRDYSKGRTGLALAGIAVAPDGSLSVLASDADYAAGLDQFLVLRYGAAGDLLWEQGVDYGPSDQPVSIAVDASGNVYFDATVRGTGPGSVGNSILLVKLDAAGQVAWSAVHEAPYAGAARLAVDAAGNAYVPGSAWDLADGIAQALLLKYDPSGALVWERRYGHGYFQNWWREAVAAPGGGVLVTGPQYAGNYDVLLARYDADGSLLWVGTYDGSPYVEYGVGLGTDGAGNAYLATTSYTSTPAAALTKYDPAGRVLWTKALDAPLGQLAATPSGALFVFVGTDLVKLAPVAP